MATAEQYAQWIVDNQDKKGSPEFETVAQAYKIAKGTPTESPQAAPETPKAPEKPDLQQIIAERLNRLKEGFMAGGPLGATLAGINSAMGDVNAGTQNVAYEAGGKVTDVAARVLPPDAAAGIGYATNVGIQAIPAVVAGKMASQAAKPTMEQAGRDLMQSALKPVLKDLRTGRAAKAIDTLLEEGVNATPGGVRILRGRIDELNRQIATDIRNSPATIDKNAVYGPVKEALDKFTRQVNPNSDISKIKAAWEEFVNHPLITGDKIPVQLAQEMKQGTGRILSGKYGEVGSAETEAQKAITRGLKEQIAKEVPQIAPLNAEESRLINALKVTERRTLIDMNRNPNGLALLAKSPEAWAAFMADKSALFKSLVARMLYSGSERIPKAVAGSGVAVMEQSGK